MYIYNLGQIFYKISEQFSDKNAIIFDADNKVSYKELNKLSNQYARYFLTVGLKQGDLICLFNTKKLNSFASMIACLKLGITYVNLDISSPEKRLLKIINRCKPKFILNDDELNIAKAAFFKINVINICNKEIIDTVLKADKNNLEVTDNICSDSPAYVMFTSGSTGFPKGAVMSHQNLINFIEWGKERYDIKKEDIFTNVNPMYFDNSVYDFYVSLFNGAAFIPLDSEIVKIPNKLVEKIDELNATIWFSVPSMLVFLLITKSLSEENFKNIRIITFGGEGFPKPKLKQLFDLYHHRVRIINVYGPTECTCICSAYDITKIDFDNMIDLAPLGYLAPNFDYVLINRNNETNEGELALTGPQVGLGYYNDRERTEKSFIKNPENHNFSQTIYKTGDLVREDKNGQLHFIARVDNQIKHMGYRIELEEIEAAFNSLEYVNEAGVIYRKFKNGLGQIIAFVAMNQEKEIDFIFNEIKEILPSYMIPKTIRILAELPKNQNGKIDRVSLKQIN